jgi:hypothetical protein
MNNKTTTQSVTKIGEQQQTGSYMQLFLYRAPKKNNEDIAKNLRQFIPSFKEYGARVEYYQLGKSETKAAIGFAKENGMDVLDSIAKVFSITVQDDEEDEEEVWMEAQYFRDYKHCKDVYAKMMQDKSPESVGNEFSGLVTQGEEAHHRWVHLS